MTISSSVSRVDYVGNGATTAFPVPFAFFDASELRVLSRVIATGAETVLALTTHYTVAGGGGTTGTVTAVAAPAASVQWSVLRNTRRTQDVDYSPNDTFPAETHEGALDRVVAVVQELERDTARSLRVAETDSTASLTLPAQADRASRVLGFDVNGNPVPVMPEAGSLAATPYALNILSSGTAATARGVLGSGTTGDAVFVASTAATARTALGVAAASAAGTALAATSGSNLDFTGIPGGVRRVVAMFSGLSTNGTLVPTVQAGTSGGVVATGYLGAWTFLDGTAVAGTLNFSTGFSLGGGLAANIRHGTVTLTRITGNTWVGEVVCGLSSSQSVATGAGTIVLGAELDRVRFTTGGADTFDAGSVNVMWEF